MKLKTNKTFTKDPRKKIEIKKIRTKLENIIYCYKYFENFKYYNCILDNKMLKNIF